MRGLRVDKGGIFVWPSSARRLQQLRMNGWNVYLRRGACFGRIKTLAESAFAKPLMLQGRLGRSLVIQSCSSPAATVNLNV